METVGIGSIIATSLPFGGIEERELVVVTTDCLDDVTGKYFVIAEDEEGNTYDVPYGWFVVVQEVITKDEIKPTDKVRITSNLDNLNQPLYVVVGIEEQGVYVVDDMGELRPVSFNSVDKLSPQDALDMMVSLSTKLVNVSNKADKHEKVLSGMKSLIGIHNIH